MELRTFWQFIKRRWLYLLLPAAIVAVVGLATYTAPAPYFTVGVRFLVGQVPTDTALLEDEERLANWQTSEYIVNGLTDWVLGQKFAERVSAEMAQQGRSVPWQEVWGALSADNTRSMLALYGNHPDRETLDALMQAAIVVLSEQNQDGMPQLSRESAEIVQLDQIVINQINPPITAQLDLPLRLALAIVAGVAIALLVEYLDRSVHNRREIESLNIPVLGEIPNHKPTANR
jgi:capsular polysaccharide biosynthesis protein